MCNTIDRRFLSDRIPDPFTAKSANEWLNMIQQSEGKNGIFRKIVVDGKIVGSITIEQKDDVYRKDAEIGYYVLPEAYSKGITTEAIRQICEIAFKILEIVRITGYVCKPNIALRKALEKNGFLLEGIMKQAATKADNIYDLCIYGKVK